MKRLLVRPAHGFPIGWHPNTDVRTPFLLLNALHCEGRKVSGEAASLDTGVAECTLNAALEKLSERADDPNPHPKPRQAEGPVAARSRGAGSPSSGAHVHAENNEARMPYTAKMLLCLKAVEDFSQEEITPTYSICKPP